MCGLQAVFVGGDGFFSSLFFKFQPVWPHKFIFSLHYFFVSTFWDCISYFCHIITMVVHSRLFTYHNAGLQIVTIFQDIISQAVGL